MATALLNPETQPEQQIPLSQVPATIRELRASWAQSFTRAEQLERERAEAVQRAEDWEHIALSNGEELAKARVEIERLKQRLDGTHGLWAAEVASDIARIAELQNELADERAAHEHTRDDMACYRDGLLSIFDDKHRPDLVKTVYDVLNELRDDDYFFNDCEHCHGDGEVRDECMVGSPGSWFGYSTRSAVGDCGECDGTGRVAK